jgi:hypothetical protein
VALPFKDPASEIPNVRFNVNENVKLITENQDQWRWAVINFSLLLGLV